MTSKRILLVVGIVAALAIGSYAMFGRPSVKNEDTSAAVGAAKKYQSEQIAEADVVLQDADIQALLQTDFFYQMVTDPDFRKLVADGTIAKLAMMDDQGRAAAANQLADLGKIGVEDANFREAVAQGDHKLAVEAAAAKGITSLTPGDLDRLNIALGGLNKYTAEDYGRLTSLAQDANFRQALEAGDFDKANVAATEHKVNMASPKDLGKLGYAEMGKLNIRILVDLGKIGVEDANFRAAVAQGDHKLAVEAAAAKGITSFSPGDLDRLNIALGGLNKYTAEDYGRLTSLAQDANFRQALEAGDFDKANAAATEHKITVANPQDLGKIGYADMGKLNVQLLQDFGKLNVEDASFREAVAQGDHKLAVQAAAAKGITSLTPGDLQRFQMAGLDKLTPSQWEALGRLTAHDSFGKTLYADGLGKLLTANNGQFKTDMAAGEVDRYTKTQKMD